MTPGWVSREPKRDIGGYVHTQARPPDHSGVLVVLRAEHPGDGASSVHSASERMNGTGDGRVIGDDLVEVRLEEFRECTRPSSLADVVVRGIERQLALDRQKEGLGNLSIALDRVHEVIPKRVAGASDTSNDSIRPIIEGNSAITLWSNRFRLERK